MSEQSKHIGDLLRTFQKLNESVDKETRLAHDTMQRSDEHGVGKYIAQFNDYGINDINSKTLVDYAKNGGIDAVLDYVMGATTTDLSSKDIDALWDIADALVTDVDSRVTESEEVTESAKPYVSMYGSEAEVLDSNGKTVKTFTRKEHGANYKEKANKYLQKHFDALKEGYEVLPSIDTVRYGDRSREGLEGPFRARNGKVYYYDPREGKAYDPDTDMFISHDDYDAMNESGDGTSPDYVDSEGRFVVVFDPMKEKYYALAMNQHYANILPMANGFASVQDAVDDAEEAIDNQLVGQQMESFSSLYVSKALVESGVHHTRAMRIMSALPNKKAYSINDVTKALEMIGESCECQDRVRNSLSENMMDIKVGDKIRTKKWGQSLGVVTGFTQKHGETRVLFKNEDGKTWSTPPENIEKVEEVTEGKNRPYTFCVPTDEWNEASAHMQDMRKFADYSADFIPGNMVELAFADSDEAYEAIVRLETANISVVNAEPAIFDDEDDDAPTWDRSSGEDEYDLDEANQRSVRTLYTEYRDPEGRFEVVYNQEKGLYLVKPKPEYEDDIEPAAFHKLDDAIEHAEMELEQWDDEGYDAGGAYDMTKDTRRFNEAEGGLPEQGPIEPAQLPKSIQEFVSKLFGVYWEREGQANVIPYSAGYGYTYKNSAGPGNTGRGLLKLGVVNSEEELYANGRPKDNFRFKLGNYDVSLAFRGNAAMLRFSGPMEESVNEVSKSMLNRYKKAARSSENKAGQDQFDARWNNEYYNDSNGDTGFRHMDDWSDEDRERYIQGGRTAKKRRKGLAVAQAKTAKHGKNLGSGKMRGYKAKVRATDESVNEGNVINRGSPEHQAYVAKKQKLEKQLNQMGKDDPQYATVKAEFDDLWKNTTVRNAPRPQSARSQETDGRYVGGKNRYTGD